jgi:hypothetical protein
MPEMVTASAEANTKPPVSFRLPGDDADIVIGKAVAGILAATHRRTARAPQPLTC